MYSIREGLELSEDSKNSVDVGAETSIRGMRMDPHGTIDKSVAGEAMNTHATVERSLGVLAAARLQCVVCV